MVSKLPYIQANTHKVKAMADLKGLSHSKQDLK